MSGTDELRRCRASFRYFCETYWKIRDAHGEVVAFQPNPPQLRLIEFLDSKRDRGTQIRVAILKARQMGFSTVCQAYLAWLAFCFKGQSGLTVAHLEEPSAELFGKIEFGWENLPPHFKPQRLGKTRGKRFQLGKSHNNALLYVDHAKNKDAGRSQTFQAAHFSEVAFWEDARTLMTAMKPALARAKVVFAESTANGMGNYFYEMWQAAEKGEGHPEWNGWYPFFAPWFEMPDYQRRPTTQDRPLSADEREYQKQFGLSLAQMLWRRDMLSEMDEEDFRQEYPSTPQEAFVTSGRPFFPHKLMDFHRPRVEAPTRMGDFRVGRDQIARFVDEPHGQLWIWQKPDERDGRYVVSADIASGGARDFTGVHVLRVLEDGLLDQVASYRGKIDPDEAATLISRLAKVYSPGRGEKRRWALVAPERNVIGMQTIAKLRDVLRYPNIYTHRHLDTVDYREAKEYGWLTTPKTRTQALEGLKEVVREGRIRIRCERTFREMETFIYDDQDRPVAPRMGWDDMVMSLAIGCAVSGRVPIGPAVVYVPSGDPLGDESW